MKSSQYCGQRNRLDQSTSLASPIQKESGQGKELRKEGVESPVEDLSMLWFVYDDRRSTVGHPKYNSLPSQRVTELASYPPAGMLAAGEVDEIAVAVGVVQEGPALLTQVPCSRVSVSLLRDWFRLSFAFTTPSSAGLSASFNASAS